MTASLTERREKHGDFVLFRAEGVEARFRLADYGLLLEGRLHGMVVYSAFIPDDEVRGLRIWLGAEMMPLEEESP